MVRANASDRAKPAHYGWWQAVSALIGLLLLAIALFALWVGQGEASCSTTVTEVALVPTSASVGPAFLPSESTIASVSPSTSIPDVESKVSITTKRECGLSSPEATILLALLGAAGLMVLPGVLRLTGLKTGGADLTDESRGHPVVDDFSDDIGGDLASKSGQALRGRRVGAFWVIHDSTEPAAKRKRSDEAGD